MYRRGDGARGQGKFEVWGDTSAEAAGRKIFVGNIAPHTKIDDILKFFGPSDIIEKVKLCHKYAVVQYKRSKDHTKAIIEKNGRMLLKRQIKVEDYNPDKSRNDWRAKKDAEASRALERYPLNAPSQGRTSRSPLRERTPYVSRSSFRSRSRSRERAPNSLFPDSSSSGANISGENNHQNEMALNMHDALFRFNLEKPALPEPMQVQRPMEFGTSYPNQQQLVPSPANLPTPTGSLDQLTLPNEIDLTLRLVITHKTANNLSLFQIQELISYFEIAKINIRKNMGIRECEQSFRQRGEELAATSCREPIVESDKSSSSDDDDSKKSEEGYRNLPGDLAAAAELMRQAMNR